MAPLPPELPGGTPAESPIDRALALALAGERDAALRWAAAVVEQDPCRPSALLLCGRLLSECNRTEMAREALELAMVAAMQGGSLPMAVAACSDLRELGGDAQAMFQKIAEVFGAESARLDHGAVKPPTLPTSADIKPLPSVLTGMALISRTTDIIRRAAAVHAQNVKRQKEPPRFHPVPLFSSLRAKALQALIEAFEVTTVDKGQVVIREGEEGAEAYIIARGELEAIRDLDGDRIVLARLTSGALFGEMALLSRAPRAASVVARRPSILLIARKATLDLLADSYPEIGEVLAEYSQRRMVQNLVRTSAILRAVAPDDRPALIQRFVTRTFEPGDVLIGQGETASGLHLIASGSVDVVREEGDETLVLATLGPGDIVGEVSLVLRKPSTASVVARHSTLSLHLPREDFLDLIREHPRILADLYELAIKRDEETSSIVAQEALSVDDELLI